MSLQLWLPLNGNLNNNGVANVTITNNGATVSTDGKIGSCYSFNGSSWIKITKPSEMTTIKNTSICAFVKSTSSTLALGGMSHDLGATYACMTLYSSGWQFVGSSTWKYVSNGTVANTAVWHHVCCVVTDTNIITYLDGAQITNTTIANAGVDKFDLTADNFIEIGCDHPGGDEYLTGLVNDFRVYDHALSPKEVKEISKALILHLPLDNNGAGGNNIIPGTSATEVQYNYPTDTSTYQDKFTATTSIIPSGSQYCLSFLAKSTVNGDKIRAHYYNPNTTTRAESNQGIVSTSTDGNIDITLSTEWKQYYIVYTQSSTTAVKHVILPRMFGSARSEAAKGSGTVSIRCLKLEEGTKPTPWCPNSTDALYSSLGFNTATVYDTSGYANNGTYSSTRPTPVADAPRYSTSLQFNGSNTFIACGRNAMVRDALTVNVWAYMDNWSSYAGRIGSCTEGGGWNFEPSGDKMAFAMGTGASANTYKSVASTHTLASLSGWTMFTGTYDGFNTKIYINGVLSNTYAAYTTKTPIYYHTGNGIFVGAEAAASATQPGSNYFNGKISDFRIYATALSATDIEELYKTSASIDNGNSLYCYNLMEE